MEPLISEASGQAANDCCHRRTKISIRRIGAEIRPRFGTRSRGVAHNQSSASRRAAVGFTGCAPRFVPNRGHSALTPDASGPLGPARSACPKSRLCAVGGCGRSCCSLHRITAFSPSRAARAGARLRPGGRLRPLTACAAPCWPRFRAIPPEQPEHDHVATVLFLVRFLADGA